MKNKRIMSFVLTAALTLSSAVMAFAEIPKGSVLIGNKAYDLNYANSTDKAIRSEIQQELVKGGKVYVKTFADKWVDNLTKKMLDETEVAALPEATYKDKDGQESIYEAGDGKLKSNSVSVASVTAVTKNSVEVQLQGEVDETLAKDVAKYSVMVAGKEVSVTAVVYDAATKKSVLTVNLDKMDGELSVNGVKADKEIDFKAPVLKSVKALDANHLEVVFSEKVDREGAEALANYSLYSYAVNTKTTLDALTGGSAGATLQEDGMTVNIVFYGTLASADGFVANTGFANAKYALYLQNSAPKKITDLAKNEVKSGLNMDFQGTTAPPEVQIKLSSAKVDKANKKLNLMFSEPVDTSAGAVKVDKMSLGGVALTPATYTPGAVVTKLELNLANLAAADWKKVQELAEGAELVIAEGALKVATGEAAPMLKKAIEFAKTPSVLSAEYNEDKNVLKLVFDTDIDVSKTLSFNGLKIGKAAANKDVFDGAKFVEGQANGKSVEIQVKDSVAKLAEVDFANEDVTFKAQVPAKMFTVVGADASDPEMNVLTNLENQVYVQDTTPPTVEVSVRAVNTLEIKASEPLQTTIEPTKIKFYDGKTPLGALDGASTAVVSDLNDDRFYTLNLSTNDSVLANKIKTAKNVTVTFEKAAIKDVNKTENEELKDVAVTKLEAGSGLQPDTASLELQTPKLVAVHFANGATTITIDAASAKSATYTFVPDTGANISISATADYSAHQDHLNIYPKTALPEGTYTLTIEGLKTSDGKAVEKQEGQGKVVFTSDMKNKDRIAAAISITVDGVAPTLVDADGSPANNNGALKFVDVDNSNSLNAGDTLTLVFSEPIVNKEMDASIFTVDNAHTLGTNPKFDVQVNNLVITLGEGATIAHGDAIQLAASSNKIQDLAGNNLSSTATALKTATLALPQDKPKIAGAIYKDTNDNGKADAGDHVIVTYDQDVKADDSADLKNEITIGSASFSEAKLEGRELTLTLNVVTGVEVGVAVTDAAGGEIKNGWGIASEDAVTLSKPEEEKGKHPKIVSLRYTKADKKLYVTLSKSVQIAGNIKFEDLFSEVHKVQVAPGGNDFTVDPADAKVLVLTLGGSDGIVAEATATAKVVASEVTDAYGQQFEDGSTYPITVEE